MTIRFIYFVARLFLTPNRLTLDNIPRPTAALRRRGRFVVNGQQPLTLTAVTPLALLAWLWSVF